PPQDGGRRRGRRSPNATADTPTMRRPLRTQLLGKREATAAPPVRRVWWLVALAVVGLGLSGCSLFRREAPRTEQVGVASWYGAELQGKRTASGERFAADALTAAHP